MDPRGPRNISGGPSAKHNKLAVLNDIFGVHEENQFRTLFIFKNTISTVTYIILNRFSDLLGMYILIWVSIPFEVNVAKIELSLQEPIIQFQSDEKIKRGRTNIHFNFEKLTELEVVSESNLIDIIAVTEVQSHDPGSLRLTNYSEFIKLRPSDHPLGKKRWRSFVFY